jgi:hypothetical protein
VNRGKKEERTEGGKEGRPDRGNRTDGYSSSTNSSTDTP